MDICPEVLSFVVLFFNSEVAFGGATVLACRAFNAVAAIDGVHRIFVHKS